MSNFCVHSWPKAIAHIDADAFFVACERVLNPSLNGKCVAVGKERGIITALSYEAKAKGVKRGMRSLEAIFASVFVMLTPIETVINSSFSIAICIFLAISS